MIFALSLYLFGVLFLTLVWLWLHKEDEDFRFAGEVNPQGWCFLLAFITVGWPSLVLFGIIKEIQKHSTAGGKPR